jgi:cysteine synthase
MISTTFVRITDLRFEPVLWGHEIVTTLEGENPGGSLKDRMVFAELNELVQTGVLKPGDAIAELSAGSTALSLAYYCQHFGLRCSLFIPRNLDRALVQKLESLGAKLYPVDPQTAYAEYNQFILKTGLRKFDQFGNLELRRHYEALGRSLSTEARFSKIIGSVGTGHSLLGIAQGSERELEVYSVEPMKAGLVAGIRNLRLESYGDLDPCRNSNLQRIELDEGDFFPFSEIESDHGLLQLSDSFRVVLAGCERILRDQSPTSVFAVGAKNSRWPLPRVE